MEHKFILYESTKGGLGNEDDVEVGRIVNSEAAHGGLRSRTSREEGRVAIATRKSTSASISGLSLVPLCHLLI